MATPSLHFVVSSSLTAKKEATHKMLTKIVLGRGPLALPFLSKMERGFRWPPLALFIFFRKCKEGVASETLAPISTMTMLKALEASAPWVFAL